MFSDVIKAALEREVVGQRRAVNSVVRGVTRLASGLIPRERQLCAYLFMGPTGTGKSHLVQVLARALHGDERRVVVVDCSHFVYGDPWMAFVAQMAPLFPASYQAPGCNPMASGLLAPPLSILQIEFLERAPKEVAKALASALETGQVTLASGLRGSLQNCLVIVTSALCADEILNEAPQIGFSGSLDEEEDDRIYRLCYERAVESFGSDLMGRLDGFIVFRGIQEEHLPEILDRRVARLDRWLADRGVRWELGPAARDFLLERGRRDLRLGALSLVRAHQKFLEFPVADLIVSGRIPVGGRVKVDRNSGHEHLHFTVEEQPVLAGIPASVQEIAIN